MKKSKPATAVYLALVSLLLLGLFPAQAQAIPAPPRPALSQVQPGALTPGRKVLVDSTDTPTLTSLARDGATLLADYGPFSLWRVSETQRNRLAGRPSVAERSDFDKIGLRGGGEINTAPGAKRPAPPINLRQNRGSAAQFWLVQFVGPVKEEWLKRLEKLGVAIVSYLPNNAYVVWADGAALARLEASVGRDPAVQWTGEFHPAYRLAPQLGSAKPGPNRPASGTTAVAVTVQFYNTPQVNASLARLQALGGRVLRQPVPVLKFVNISLELPAASFEAVASWPDVLNVEPWVAPRRYDERQGQLIAGNANNTGGTLQPASPGYLNWLASKGFPTTPESYPIVDVVDDGIDNGSSSPLDPDFYVLGSKANSDRLIYNLNCTSDPTPNAVGGHGNINLSIVGGYNNSSGTPYQDSQGYRLGLGISPYGRLAGTKIFANVGSYDTSSCGNTDQGVVAASYNAGATITSNSWGSPTYGAYTATSQSYDVLTRDAYGPLSGNQQMLHVFAAGNDGPTFESIGSPATAKNVFTVGASEGVRDEGVADGCGVLAANNANDLAGFSSRGPTSDGRLKPDIIAAGTHIQGAASQDAGYNATGLCGAGPPNLKGAYYPIGQTLYTWSSGTSHSTPAVAGAASLVYNYYQRVLKPGQTPSPAMLKALLLNSPRYLNGLDTGGSLPGLGQGWGSLNLQTLFDGTPQALVDQTITLSATGQQYLRSGTIVDSSKPLRISLVWTDAPGTPLGNAYVNDLNLQLTINGQVYKGNVFNGATSVTGGEFDSRNNVETIYLPAGLSGSFQIKITAANLAGDGVPGNATPTDQDFALVAYNADFVPTPVLTPISRTVSDATSGNQNGVIEPGESIRLSIALANVGDANAVAVTSTLALTSGNATIDQATLTYGDIGPGTVATNSNPAQFSFVVGAAQPCGASLGFNQTVFYNNGTSVVFAFDLPVGVRTLGPAVTPASADVPKPIPDGSVAMPGTITSTLAVASTGRVGKLKVRLDITHSWVGDLVVRLESPQGKVVKLINGVGADANNFDQVILDDAAPTAIGEGFAPFTGPYRPSEPLTAFVGDNMNGTWKLHVADEFAVDVGTLNSWSLDIAPLVFVCADLVPASLTAQAGANQSSALNRRFGIPLSVVVLNAANVPVGGATVNFTAPVLNQASGTFPNGSNTFNVLTNPSGVATATLTANNQVGQFSVSASVSQLAGPVIFDKLKNVAVCAPLQVTFTNSGSAATCGTMAHALTNAGPGDIISFSLDSGTTVNVTGPLPPVPANVALDGGICGPTGPGLTLLNNGTPALTPGLQLSGSNSLRNLKISGFSGPPLELIGRGNRLFCVKLQTSP